MWRWIWWWCTADIRGNQRDTTYYQIWSILAISYTPKHWNFTSCRKRARVLLVLPECFWGRARCCTPPRRLSAWPLTWPSAASSSASSTPSSSASWSSRSAPSPRCCTSALIRGRCSALVPDAVPAVPAVVAGYPASRLWCDAALVALESSRFYSRLF